MLAANWRSGLARTSLIEPIFEDGEVVTSKLDFT